MTEKEDRIPEQGGLKANLKTVMDAVPVGILVFDEREKIIYANPEAERLFRKRTTGAGDVRCGDFISCANRHSDPRGCGQTPACPTCRIYRGLRDILSGSAALREGEADLCREMGCTPIWIKYKFSRLSFNGNRRAVLAVDDITDRRRAEAEKAELEARLHQV